MLRLYGLTIGMLTLKHGIVKATTLLRTTARVTESLDRDCLVVLAVVGTSQLVLREETLLAS